MAPHILELAPILYEMGNLLVQCTDSFPCTHNLVGWALEDVLALLPSVANRGLLRRG